MGINIEEIRAQLAIQRAEKEGKTISVSIDAKLTNRIENLIVPVSDSQKTTYIKLCRDKGQQLDMTYTKWDGRKGSQMDKEIQRLLKLPTIKRPSEPQIEALKDICTRNDWQVPEYTHLTGGREGTMSALISDLMKLEQEVRRTAPPTENQIETILEMYYCADIDFSDLHEDFAIVYTKDASGKIWNTRVNQEELLLALPELVTYQQASDFIYKNHSTFYKWKVTRLSEGQMNAIRRLQEKSGMIPMAEYQLLQFSKTDAKKYLDTLEYVWRDKDLVKFASECTIDDVRGCKTIEQAEEKDYEMRHNIIHSIYAMMGMLASDENIDAEDMDTVVREASQVACEVCGVQSVYDLLITVFDESEVCDILNIEVTE